MMLAWRNLPGHQSETTDLSLEADRCVQPRLRQFDLIAVSLGEVDGRIAGAVESTRRQLYRGVRRLNVIVELLPARDRLQGMLAEEQAGSVWELEIVAG